MTCIVGVVQDDRVYIGGDSVGVELPADAIVLTNPKVLGKTSARVLIGYCGSYRIGQLLQFQDAPFYKGGDPFAWMVVEFVEHLRAIFKKHGVLRVVESKEWGGCMLVGVGGRLFRVEDEFQVTESRHGFNAIGSGNGPALGSLLSTSPQTVRAPMRVSMALTAAATFSAFVRPPFLIKAIDAKGAIHDD